MQQRGRIVRPVLILFSFLLTACATTQPPDSSRKESATPKAPSQRRSETRSRPQAAQEPKPKDGRTARAPKTSDKKRRETGLGDLQSRPRDIYALYSKATAARKKGSWEDVAALLERAVERAPSFAEAFNDLGVAY